MFLTPRFVPKTIEELKGQRTDNAELARQEARLKQQFLDIRDYHRRLLPTGISQNLLPEEEEEEEQAPEEAESTSGASTEGMDDEEESDEMADVNEGDSDWPSE